MEIEAEPATTSETVVPATPEETWEAITDPERLGEWLADDAEVELEPGGGLAVRIGEEERSGFVEEVSEPERFVFWWSADDGEASRVEIELSPEGEDTRVRVVESRPLAALDVRGVPLATRIGGGASPGDAQAGGASAPQLAAVAG